MRIALLLWPDVRPMTVALIEEVLRLAQRLQPAARYELRHYLSDQPPASFSDCQWLFALAEEPPAAPSPALLQALRNAAEHGCALGALGAGLYPLAYCGLLDGYKAALHWRWHEDFAEHFAKVEICDQLFEWDRDRLTCCGGLAVVDLLLAMLAQEHGAELATAISEELVLERIREGSERQRVPLHNRLGATHPKLSQAVLLMEAHIEEPLTTDEIAQQVCVSRRQLERIFKQYLNQVPSQYYLELRLNRARKLLQQSSKSIIQIGLSCGFSSGPHFSSAYRNFFGVTPRDDRNQRRGPLPGEAPLAAERG